MKINQIFEIKIFICKWKKFLYMIYFNWQRNVKKKKYLNFKLVNQSPFVKKNDENLIIKFKYYINLLSFFFIVFLIF